MSIKESRGTRNSSEQRARPAVWRRWVPVLVWMAFIFALSSRSRLPQPPGVSPDLTAIAGHFVLYATLAALLVWGLGATGMPIRWRLLVALLAAIAYGVSDEYHQSFVPGRDSSPFDVGVDTLGALAGVNLAWFVATRRHRFRGP